MHVLEYLRETVEICNRVSQADIERLVKALSELKGRLYLIGLGGSLANAIHLAADLRKLCDIDAEAFDNIAELTARANDEGLDSIFVDWLKRSTQADALLVLSVGGGTSMVSGSLIKAIGNFKGSVYGIVGPHGGFTASQGKIVIKIPVENKDHVTPQTEAFQSIISHCLVSHPLLQKNKTKW